MYWPFWAKESIPTASLWDAAAIVVRCLTHGPIVALVAVFAVCALDSAVSAAPGNSRTSEHLGDGGEAQISPAVRRERAGLIRDTAAGVGMTNAVLLAGIGQVETGFAHCWSEATWACQGPASSSCDGGPVIAGSADGACSKEQGGLGMFQFDSGTFADTIGTYGSIIVTMEGNVEAVVPFLVTRAIQSIDGVSNEQEALAWMNSIPIVAGDPLFEEWIYFVSWRYNGCQGCSSQEDKYRDGTLLLQDEMGADFWLVSSEDPCRPIEGDSTIIEEGDACATLGGPISSWRSEARGHGGGLRWTKTTDDAAESNYGAWRLRFANPGDYEVFVYTDGGEFGQSQQAGYRVSHAEGDDVIVINQSSSEGWRSLGTFTFGVGDGHEVHVGDNTGEPLEADPGGVRLAFDALRVDAIDVPDVTDEPEEEPETMGSDSFCSASASSTTATGLWLLFFALFLLGRRRRN